MFDNIMEIDIGGVKKVFKISENYIVLIYCDYKWSEVKLKLK